MKNERSRLLRHFDRTNTVTALVISFIFALIFGLLNPLDIFFANRADFFVSLSEALRSLLLPSFLTFLAVLLILFLALLLHKAVFEMLKYVLLGITAAAYCQELFLNGKMILGDNGTNLGEITSTEETVNLLIHFAVIAFFVILAASRWMPGRKEASSEADAAGNDSDGGFISRNIVAYAFAGILLMKAIGFGSAYAGAVKDSHIGKNDAPVTVDFYSYEPTVSFSKDQNICVFVVDMFDSTWCDAFLELYPEVREELEGFTFYQNNTAWYCDTFPSVCSILTHEGYDWSISREAYFEQAWAGDSVLSVLKDNGYQINLVLDAPVTYGDSSLIRDYCDNFVAPENLEQEVDRKTLRRILYHLSFSRILPYAFKVLVPNELGAVSEVEYLIISSKEPEKVTIDTVNNLTDIHLYEYVRSAEFDAECEKDVCTIIHLNGAHDENLPLAEEMGAEKGEVIQRTIRANFETMLYYIRSAKELGVYDQTTFVILADHGSRFDDLYDDSLHLIKPTLPTLMIKPANAERSPFRYDSETGLSNEMFMASILEYAGIAHQEYGYSYQDIISSRQVVPREFVWRERTTTKKDHYIITGDARDFSNWKEADG